MSHKIKIGKYKHYKGHICNVIGVARHSEALEEFVVYTHPDKDGNDELWVRPIEMFLEYVEVGDYKGPRFEYIKK